MANKHGGKTILTGAPTAKQLANKKKRKQDYDIVELGCKIWYETLKDKAVSRNKAVKEIISLIIFNINVEHIYEKAGARLMGEYIIKCHRERDVCTRKTTPTGWVGLAQEVTAKLPNPKRPNANGDVTVYENLSTRLAEYGMYFSERTLIRWVEETK